MAWRHFSPDNASQPPLASLLLPRPNPPVGALLATPWAELRARQVISLRLEESVASTMDAARQEVLRGRVAFDRQGRTRYVGILAREQTAGRGQRGRAWFAPYNEALCITYFVRYGLADPQRAAQLAFLGGVAVADTIRALLADTTAPLDINQEQREGSAYTAKLRPAEQPVPDIGMKQPDAIYPSMKPQPAEHPLPGIGLKWPNDVLLNGKKLGGILIEMVKAPDGDWVALVGVGLNLAVRAFPPKLAPTATSLALEGLSIASLPPEIVASHIARSFTILATLIQTQGFAALLERWRAYDRTAGRRYETDWDGLSTEGIAVGIDETGALLLRLSDGTVRPVSSASSLQELPATP